MVTSNVNFRAGADPEVFLVDKTSSELVAVCGLIGHDKWNPLQVADMPEGFTFQEDNVALEFGIPPAASCAEFIHHIKAVQRRFLKEHKHLTFSKLSATLFPAKQLKHPGAKIFGCEPDFNAWSGEVNPRPEAPSKLLRSAGGHVHIETQLPVREVIKSLDVYLGIPSVLMDDGEMRKQLYGKHGAYRPKSYGGEYRTLSNFWIFQDKYIKWVWDNTQRALEEVSAGKKVDYLHGEIIECIDNNNKDLAKTLVKELSLEVV